MPSCNLLILFCVSHFLFPCVCASRQTHSRSREIILATKETGIDFIWCWRHICGTTAWSRLLHWIGSTLKEEALELLIQEVSAESRGSMTEGLWSVKWCSTHGWSMPVRDWKCVNVCGHLWWILQTWQESPHHLWSEFLHFLRKVTHIFPESVGFILHVLPLCCARLCLTELEEILNCSSSNGEMSSSDQTDLAVASALPHFELPVSTAAKPRLCFTAFSSKDPYWNWLAKTIHSRAFWFFYCCSFFRQPKCKLTAVQLPCKVVFNHRGWKLWV